MLCAFDYLCVISSFAFLPPCPLRGEALEMPVVLQRKELRRLLQWHCVVLLGSLFNLSRLLITAACLLSCGLIWMRWDLRLLPWGGQGWNVSATDAQVCVWGVGDQHVPLFKSFC